MVKLYVFSDEDQAALRELLGPNAPIDKLSDVVTNVQASRKCDSGRTKPKEARKVLNVVSHAAWELLRALEALPIDLRDTYLNYSEHGKHISSQEDVAVDIDLLGFVFSLALAADNSVNFDEQTKAKRGRPRDDSQWLLAVSVAHVLRDAGYAITSTESGPFVSTLDLCAPAAGYELEEVRHLARMVTSGKKWP